MMILRQLSRFTHLKTPFLVRYSSIVFTQHCQLSTEPYVTLPISPIMKLFSPDSILMEPTLSFFSTNFHYFGVMGGLATTIVFYHMVVLLPVKLMLLNNSMKRSRLQPELTAKVKKLTQDIEHKARQHKWAPSRAKLEFKTRFEDLQYDLFEEYKYHPRKVMVHSVLNTTGLFVGALAVLNMSGLAQLPNQWLDHMDPAAYKTWIEDFEFSFFENGVLWFPDLTGYDVTLPLIYGGLQLLFIVPTMVRRNQILQNVMSKSPASAIRRMKRFVIITSFSVPVLMTALLINLPVSLTVYLMYWSGMSILTYFMYNNPLFSAILKNKMDKIKTSS